MLHCPVFCQDDIALTYLARYGYLPRPAAGGSYTDAAQEEEGVAHDDPGVAVTEDNVREAVTKFQEFAGLQQTGVVNNETLQLMMTPRCGFRDFEIRNRTIGEYQTQGGR